MKNSVWITLLLFVLISVISVSSIVSQETGSANSKKNSENERPIDKPVEEKISNQKKQTEKTNPKNENFEDLLKKEMEGSEIVVENNTSWFVQFLKTTFLLAVIIGIFYGVLRVYRFKKQLQINESETIKILHQYPLMPGKYLQIVQISGKIYFLGISDAGVQLISEIKDQDYYQRIRLDLEKDNNIPRVDFLTELTKVIKDKVSDVREKRSAPSNNAYIDNTELDYSRNSVRNHINDLKNRKETFMSDLNEPEDAENKREGL